MDNKSIENRGFSLARVISALSTVLGILSFVQLAERGFHFGFAPITGDILGWYDDKVRIALGWAEPYINAALAQLPWHMPKIDPFWRQSLVIVGAWWGPEIRYDFLELLGQKKKIDAYGYLMGMIFAVFLSAILFGIELGFLAGNSQVLLEPMLVGFFLLVLVCFVSAIIATIFRSWRNGTSLKAAWEGSKTGKISLASLTIFGGGAIVILINAGLK